jgi:site-specific DNA recombinase
MSQTPVRAGIYARISEDKKGDMLGVSRQERLCRDKAGVLGWEVVEVYVDDDISAWSGKRRPSYRRMLEDIASGRITGMVVYDLDRLHRRPKELEEFIEVCERAGVKSLATVSGDVDLSTEHGRLHARIMGAVAMGSSDATSRRLKDKHDEMATNGLPHGPRTFGYQSDRMHVDPIEAGVIREMIQRVFTGESARSIALDLNARGVRGAGGGKWDSTGVRGLIKNPRLAGLRVHRGAVVGPGAWEPIIDAATHERIKAYYDDPMRKVNRPPRVRLLTGLVYCGLCNSRLNYSGKLGQLRCFKSPANGACGRVFINAQYTEDYVTSMVLASGRELLLKRKAESGEAEVLKEIARLEDRKDELGDMYAKGELERPDYSTAYRAITGRLTLARKELNAINVEMAVDKALSAITAWDTATLDQRRLVLMRYLERVRVMRVGKESGAFDPNRIQLDWAR